MKKSLLTCLCFLCAFSFLFAEAKKRDPWVEWRRGYELFIEGDKYMRRNQLEEALSAYKRSRDTYKAVLEANTGWNKNLINSKISACDTQILKIERRLRESGRKSISAPAAKPSRPSAVEPSTPSRTVASSSSSSDDEYKRKYFNLYIEVENLRKQLRSHAQAAKNIDALLKEKRLAEEKAATLQRSIENLRRQIARPEEELKNVRKQLIAERLKTEQLIAVRSTNENTINSLRNESKKLNDEFSALQKKLQDSIKSKETLNDTINDLRKKLVAVQDDIADERKDLKKYKDEIDSLEKSLAESRKEVKKLNSWIDEINKKKGDSEKLSQDIVNENRKIKNDIVSMQNEIRKLENINKDIIAKAQKFERDYTNASQTVAVLNNQKKNLENELKSVRELYVSQVNAEKQTKAELETLRAEQKKNAATLQTYINRNAELTAMLDTKDSATAGYSKRLEGLQKELDEKQLQIKKLNDTISKNSNNVSAEKVSLITKDYEKLRKANKDLYNANEKLSNENNALAAELRSVKNELAVIRKPDNSKNVKSAATSENNSDYKKLLAAYNDLKNKYDFLSAEIESLNKPLADVNDKAPEINSDKELANFLLKAAKDASKAQDYISAAWYFSELQKQDSSNTLYKYGYALYSAIASDRANAEKIVSALPDSREKFILFGVISMLDGKKSAAASNFKKAGNKKFTSTEIRTLYANELPLVMGMFNQKGDMKDNISVLKELLDR